jgi:hypothetical protein
MIRRKLLMATAILASAAMTACSDTTAPKNDPGVFPVAANRPTVVATINGGGTAEMQPGGLAQGRTAFGMGVKLLADGSATGHIDCVDQHGGNFPGNIFGEVTSWRKEGTVVVLNVTGKLVSFPGGHPQDISFTVKIQQFGGAGVGRWTLEVGGVIFCVELLTSGQIVYRPRED